MKRDPVYFFIDATEAPMSIHDRFGTVRASEIIEEAHAADACANTCDSDAGAFPFEDANGNPRDVSVSEAIAYLVGLDDGAIRAYVPIAEALKNGASATGRMRTVKLSAAEVAELV